MSTSIDYGTVSHETIYSSITGGLGSAGLADASQGWQDVAVTLQELQDLVDQAVQQIGVSQQGAAADAATGAALALTQWISDGVGVASAIAARVAEQSSAFTYTRDNMPPALTVPEVSFSQDPEAWLADHTVEWLPGIQTEHEQALVAAQQAEQRARELMDLYQGLSNENLTIGQQFSTAPAVVAGIAEPAPDGAGFGGALSVLGLQPSPMQPYLAHTGSSAGVLAGGPGADAPAATAHQLASGILHQGVLQQGILPQGVLHQGVLHQAMPPAATSPQVAGDYPSPVDQPGAGPVRPGTAASVGPSPILAGPAAVGGDRVRGGSRSSGARRGGGFGPRPNAASSTGNSWLGGSPGLVSPGLNSPGLNSPGLHSPGLDSSEHGNPVQNSAELAGAGRAARGAGWADAPLSAPSGAGPAERRRPSYLIEQDTSAIVGELPLVAPPVIGADEGYR